MIFDKHSELDGLHAFLSPSNYHWINYTDERLIERYTTQQAAIRGSRLHEFACEAIKLGVKLPATSSTLNAYVNDAIKYRMTPEQVLYFSPNCFGTADTISFQRNKLRIHDLKTGVSKTSEKQLEVYAALFSLEYGVNPFDISIELRIYQADEVRVYDGVPDNIIHIMDRIKSFDKLITELRSQQ